MLVLSRYLANFFLLIGQGIILYSSLEIGILIKCFAGLIILSSLIKSKMWDMVIVLTSFILLDLSKLILNT
jgi:hypothetical protein